MPAATARPSISQRTLRPLATSCNRWFAGGMSGSSATTVPAVGARMALGAFALAASRVSLSSHGILLGACDEPFVAVGLRSGDVVHAASDQARRRCRSAARRAQVQIAHHARPHGRGAARAADTPHRRPACVTDPDAHGVTLRPANRPVVAHVLAGPRFDGRPEACGQYAFCSEGPRPCVPIRKDIAHDECCTRIEDLREVRPCTWRENDGAMPSAIGQRAISVRQVQQIDVGAAQCQAVAVPAARFP